MRSQGLRAAPPGPGPQRPIGALLKGLPSGQDPSTQQPSGRKGSGWRQPGRDVRPGRAGSRAGTYLHVEDLVRALRLPRDVADLGGGLGGQRGGGVAVDSRVAQGAVLGGEGAVNSVSELHLILCWLGMRPTGKNHCPPVCLAPLARLHVYLLLTLLTLRWQQVSAAAWRANRVIKQEQTGQTAP